MKLSFKKRIAVLNTITVAITTAIVFVVIYSVVHYSSYRHLDYDILAEKEEIMTSLAWRGDSIIINRLPEWEEAEHKKVEVNPTFIQIVDAKGMAIFKSANLKANLFLFNPSIENEQFYNIKIETQRLRAGQFPIRNDQGRIIGQLTVCISQQESHNVLQNLLFTLCISFPAVLLVLYIAIYLAASKAIQPVNQLIRAATDINDSNINIRLPLPENEDELYQLARTINELLNRLEIVLQQQKQFTADASHEIRTPLSAIRGTLDVLLRRKRTPEQYEEKIREVIGHTDRLSQLLDQLLQLARLESIPAKKENVPLSKLINETTQNWEKQRAEKGLSIQINIPDNITVPAYLPFLSIIVDNLLSNAIKYSALKGNICFDWDQQFKQLSVRNDGPGIKREQMPYLFDRFYRTDSSRSSQIPGSGLGLAIVKKLSDLEQIVISVTSVPGETTFFLRFSR